MKGTSGSLANSAEILPRLRMVTSPYAMMAGSVPGGSLTSTNINAAFGLWNRSGNNLYWTNGNVGIGTTTPNAPLTVSDFGVSRVEKMTLGSTVGVNFNIFDPSGFGLFAGIANTGNSWLQAGRSDTATAYNLILQGSGGNVGIGTTTPLAPLEVSGTEVAPALNANNQMMSVRGSPNFIGLNFGHYPTAPYASWIQSQRTTDSSVWPLAINPLGGNVGIGTATPNAPLQVVTANGFPNPGISLAGSGSDLMLSMQNTSASGHYWNLLSSGTGSGVPGALRFYDATLGGDRMVITGAGNVGIGTVSPDNVLHLRQTAGNYQNNIWSLVFEDSVYSGGGGYNKTGMRINTGGGWFEIAAAIGAGTPPGLARLGNNGVWTAVSDRRIKKDIVPAEGLLAGALQLEPVNFHFKTEQPDAGLHLGFIAQDVRKVFPSLVTGIESRDTLSLDYSTMSAVAIGAIKELARQVKAQETELTELRAELAKLRTEKKSLAATVTELKAQDEARESRLARLEKALDSRPAVIEAKATTRDLSRLAK